MFAARTKYTTFGCEIDRDKLLGEKNYGDISREYKRAYFARITN